MISSQIYVSLSSFHLRNNIGFWIWDLPLLSEKSCRLWLILGGSRCLAAKIRPQRRTIKAILRSEHCYWNDDYKLEQFKEKICATHQERHFKHPSAVKGGVNFTITPNYRGTTNLQGIYKMLNMNREQLSQHHNPKSAWIQHLQTECNMKATLRKKEKGPPISSLR